VKAIVLFFAFVLATLAQTQAPKNFAAAGFGYNPAASPDGWLAYATLLTDKGPIYNYSEITITSASVKAGQFKAQTAITTGVATTVKTYGPLTIFGLANAGMATTGSTIGGAFAGGGVAVWKIKNSVWSIVIGAQVLKTTANTQVLASIGVGRSF
jgi:hypothetical protein